MELERSGWSWHLFGRWTRQDLCRTGCEGVKEKDTGPMGVLYSPPQPLRLASDCVLVSVYWLPWDMSMCISAAGLRGSVTLSQEMGRWFQKRSTLISEHCFQVVGQGR